MQAWPGEVSSRSNSDAFRRASRRLLTRLQADQVRLCLAEAPQLIFKLAQATLDVRDGTLGPRAVVSGCPCLYVSLLLDDSFLG